MKASVTVTVQAHPNMQLMLVRYITTCMAKYNKLCTWRHNMPRPSPSVAPSNRRNVAVLSHVEYVPTLTAAAALRVTAALNKAAW